MGTIVNVQDIVKIYNPGEHRVRALKGITLQVMEGEFVAVMGSSGSGKSTFLNILGCLDEPTTGRYLLNGTDVQNLSKEELAQVRNRNIGFVFQSYNLLPRTTALENVELPLFYNPGMSTREQRQRAEAALEVVGLKDRTHHMPNELSGGQQQRVAIARALVNNPVMILADEPTGNLDSKTGYQILEQFQKLNDRGITVIMVTHEKDISSFAKRRIVFRDGHILLDEAVDQQRNTRELLEKLEREDVV